MRNEIKSNQLAVLLLLIVPGGKYLSLPSILSQMVGRDAWIVMGLMLLIDAVGLCLVLWGLHLNSEGKSFFEILQQSVSKIVAILIVTMFIALFSLKATFILTSCYHLFSVNFSVKTGWFGFVLPIAILSVFIISKGFGSIAKMGELFVFIITLSLAIILFFSTKVAEFDDLRPMLVDGFLPVAKSLPQVAFWFGDYVFILFVMDNVKKQKGLFCFPLVYFAISVVLVVFMTVLFVALFGPLSSIGKIAISKVSQFLLPASLNGRLDWLSMSIWVSTLFLKLFVYCYCIYKSYEYLFSTPSAKFNLWQGILVVIPMVIIPLFVNVDGLVNLVMTSWIQYVVIVVTHLIPFLTPLFVKIANLKRPQRSIKDGTT